MEWHCAEDLYLCVCIDCVCFYSSVFVLLSTMAAIITKSLPQKTLPGPHGPHQYQKDSICETTVCGSQGIED